MSLWSRKKKRSRLGVLLKSLTVLAVVGIAAVLAVAYLAMPDLSRAGSFSVTDGDSARTVATRLKETGIIRSETLFLLVVKADGTDRRFQSGTYDLRGAASLYAIGRILTGDGRSQEELTLVVREGWTLRDIAAELKRLGFAHADEFLTATGEPTTMAFAPPPSWLARYPFLKVRTSGTSLEGYLFPDTYRVFRGATAASVVEKLLDNFGRHLTSEVMEAVSASGHEFSNVIIMASVLEEEIKTPADRRLVADVFWRRLGQGMRLQADSTVNYALGTARPSVTASDLESKSPYNTYRIIGLPPGPICNPGLDAIMAAARPTPNDNWYFLTEAAGAVHYAKTYEQHLANKAKYLK
jgi:UPF0755 protein